MILSHQKKFIYIHIYKVAGMSIRSALQPFDEMSKKEFPWYENIKFDLGQRFKFLSGWALDHIKAKQVKKYLAPEVYNNYYKFTFVRNPWDWQVSLYHFMLQVPNHPQHRLVTKMKSFDEYIEWRVNEDLELQRDFIYDDQGNKILDFVGRFEHLQEDFNVICQNIGLAPVQLPYINKSKHKPYKEYYSEHSKNLIGKAFKEDIELFKYEF
jgi:hypothetical protein